MKYLMWFNIEYSMHDAQHQVSSAKCTGVLAVLLYSKFTFIYIASNHNKSPQDAFYSKVKTPWGKNP